MINKQSDFHSNPSRCFRHTPSRNLPLLQVILLCPELRPFNYHYSNEPSICDAFDYYTHVPYISDALHIIRSVFNPYFIHYTKYAKYAFLLLSSIGLIFFSYFGPSGILGSDRKQNIA